MENLENTAVGSATQNSMKNPASSRREIDIADRVYLFALGIAILFLWEVASTLGWINALFFPAPSAIATSFGTLLISGELLDNLAATLGRTGYGLLAGCTSGLAIGILLGWSDRLRRLLDPVIGALYPLPKLALFPLFLVIFGLGEAPRVVLISLATFFPMLINTLAGVRQINPEYFEIAKGYGASRGILLFRVVLPGALPSVLSGLRLAVGNALITTIAVELLNADTGLGAQIWWAWETLRTEVLYVMILLAAGLGIGSHYALEFLSSRLLPWQREDSNRIPVNPISEI
jgi:ABC-type nitrate/sulfonate/bicarbonate transport system permease component